MKPKKWEVLLVLGLILGLCLWGFWPRKAGRSVTVTVDGAESGTYALEQDLRQPVDGYDGFTLTLVIENGAAHVEDSTCPDLICQHHASISRAGEQIVCLPGRVVIAVTETGKEAEIDAITG